jgi:hypothetical protein
MKRLRDKLRVQDGMKTDSDIDSNKNNRTRTTGITDRWITPQHGDQDLSETPEPHHPGEA